MNWDQIKEIEKEGFAVIGHHSHTHEYLIEKSNEEFINDIETANSIFKNKLGYVPDLFSYPFEVNIRLGFLLLQYIFQPHYQLFLSLACRHVEHVQ